MRRETWPLSDSFKELVSFSLNRIFGVSLYMNTDQHMIRGAARL